MKKKKDDNVMPSPREVEEFERSLIQKRTEILSDVNQMEDGTIRKSRSELSNVPFHMADQGSDSFETDFTLDLMESERIALRQIDEALDRISEGTYGLCLNCEKPIPLGRLEAIAWARYCVSCASLAEKGLLEKTEEI